MNITAPSSRTVLVWAIGIAVSFLAAGSLVAFQREKNARPDRLARPSSESSIPHLSLEELEKDFRSPAHVRRYKGQFVEVAGTVVWTTKVEGRSERERPTVLVYLAPGAGEEPTVCGALHGGPAPSDLRAGEEVVLQGKVGVVLYEGPQQIGLVDARVVSRLGR